MMMIQDILEYFCPDRNELICRRKLIGRLPARGLDWCFPIYRLNAADQQGGLLIEISGRNWAPTELHARKYSVSHRVLYYRRGCSSWNKVYGDAPYSVSRCQRKSESLLPWKHACGGPVDMYIRPLYIAEEWGFMLDNSL